VSDTSYLSFQLSPNFIKKYENRDVNWGYMAPNGVSLGEITYVDKYARDVGIRTGKVDPNWNKPDDEHEETRKEKWFECVKRVVEGAYSIQKDYCQKSHIPWSDGKAQYSAQEMYDIIFNFKMLPPGRGLWRMGSRQVYETGNSASLNNCGFVTTENINQNFAEPFIWTMEASMLGVGVGFDTRGAGKVEIKKPEGHFPYTIPDTREGWVKSVELLLEAYIYGSKLPCFNYDKIRPAGSPIRGFGGVASGPAPLIELHETLKDLLEGRAGEVITSRDIVDIMNLVGKCVVSGNVRRSAEIALGDFNDSDFFYIKDWTRPENRKRTDMDKGWAGMSNNSLIVTRKDEPDFDFLANHIAQTNGDPGLFWLEKAQKFGRMVDPPNWKDRRARGTNPCSEQTLEAFELCCLVETFPMKHKDLKDFFRTLKFAYLYAKSVTLLPTHWPKTNQIMKRNMRIGTSMSGLAQFVDNRGLMQLIDWMDKGYKEVQRRDEQYSEWLGVRQSIKTTSIKPSGTVSLLAGVTPGVHWPIAPTYIRRMRYADTNPLLPRLREAGYDMFWSNRDQAWVVDFPMKGPQVRSEFDVPVIEKVSLAAAAQKFWADNQVSATITFFADKPEELRDALELYADDLKSISALTMSKNVYTETVDGVEYSIMPYEGITDEEFEEKAYKLEAIDLSVLYNSQEAAKGEAYCDSDVCEIAF
jgi:ribonucleoside-triphosphate reductase (thioredoxin)